MKLIYELLICCKTVHQRYYVNLTSQLIINPPSILCGTAVSSGVEKVHGISRSRVNDDGLIEETWCFTNSGTVSTRKEVGLCARQ